MPWSRKLWLVPVLGVAGAGLVALQPPLQAVPAAEEQPAAGKSVTLPVSQVVLFNSGVGYFARAGQIEGDARVELTFPETDINDLLKSLTLEDFNGGRVEAVGYDSRDPVGRTLASYAINLSANPSLAQILMQARGEKVEVTLKAAPQPVAGTIVGIETQKLPANDDKGTLVEVESLTLLTADGLRTLKMMDVSRVKFSNPALEDELKRALETLARSHDASKKAVTLQFSGAGKRNVKVGYVVEAPIWKTSYRLVLTGDEKPTLQGWAMVENPSNDDWTNVKLALVSGRPISFKMDLYNPLYVGRPTVEPELFASLRPPAYQGDVAANRPGARGAGFPGGMADAPAAAMATPGGPGFGGIGGGGIGGGGIGGRAEKMQEQRETYAKNVQLEMARKMEQSVASAAAASQLGDFFQYVIDHPVTIPRQKSAMIPIVAKPVEGTRVSIYNETVQTKHPLLGLRFKNTTGAHLAQGPITVYEGSSYSGDSRILDLQPGEERLLAYAIDLGTEVVPQVGPGTANVVSVRVNRGLVSINRKYREIKIYKAVNRSGTDRTLIIEHPNRTDQQYKLVEPAKPTEETAELLRFQVNAAANKPTEFKVVEERTLEEYTQLTDNPNFITYLLSETQVSPELRKKLEKAQELRGELDRLNTEVAQVTARLDRINQDQTRIRENLKSTPKEADVYGKYLNKLSEQEKQIDTLTDELSRVTTRVAEALKAYTEYLQQLDG